MGIGEAIREKAAAEAAVVEDRVKKTVHTRIQALERWRSMAMLQHDRLQKALAAARLELVEKDVLIASLRHNLRTLEEINSFAVKRTRELELLREVRPSGDVFDLPELPSVVSLVAAEALTQPHGGVERQESEPERSDDGL